MNVEAVLAQLQGVRRSGVGWQGLCPAHDDRNPSLSINERDGKALLHCHAGCALEAICAAAGIEMHELFAQSDSEHKNGERKIVDHYNYTNEDGELLFQVLRYHPKAFSQRRPDGNGGWISNLNGVRRVLYLLHGIKSTDHVVVPEGEKDAQAAWLLGFPATCNPGGAGKWKDEFSECLRGKDVIIIADADDTGPKHAQRLATSLYLRARSI